MSMMIVQSASSVAGCIQEGRNCGSAGTQQKEEAVKIPPVPQYCMLALKTRL